MDWHLISIPFIAFICEFLDSTLGGGFGTILTPILLLFGYTPLQIVPCILVSEIITGIGSGVFHQKEGNVNFKDPAIQRLTLALAGCAVIGTISAVVFSFKVPKQLVSMYIGWLITILGVLLVWRGGREIVFNKTKIIFFGIIAAFNKGISGGGYGPLMTGANVYSGVKPKHAIGVVGMAEGIVCIVGLVTYFVMKKNIDFTLLPWILAGSILSPFYCAKVVKVTNDKLLAKGMAWLILLLGLATVFKLSQP